MKEVEPLENMPQDLTQTNDAWFSLYLITILGLILLVPLLVLPNYLDNPFFTPKTLLIILGVSFMIALYTTRFLRGRTVPKSTASTPHFAIILIILNFLSFFYTDNYYYTKVAALMNISCLLFFYFVSLYVDGKRAFWILGAVAFCGVLVSIITYLQFGEYSVLSKWNTGGRVIGTIGNSNYLGAYLLFPLFALSGLILLLKGKLRLLAAGLFIFVFGALLLSRARASWLGFSISLVVFLVLIKSIYNFSVLDYMRSNLKRVTVCGILILSFVVTLLAIAHERFQSEINMNQWTETKTLNVRLKYFRASWWLFKQSPLFGTGLWSYRNGVYDAQAQINKRDPGFFRNYKKPQSRRVHNEYLEILNDGGLIAAAFLLMFFIVVMRHGWRVIRCREIKTGERVIAASAFASVTGIMAAAFFFFPFRINTTLFMTVLTMGLMEAIYLRNFSHLSASQWSKRPFSPFVIVLIVLTLAGIFYFMGYRPLKGEFECFQYRKAFAQRKAEDAERHILKALTYDPENTAYCFSAGQLYLHIMQDYVKAGQFFEKAIIDFNGDLTRWHTHFAKGLVKLRMGSLFEAQDAFQKSLYYNPNFSQARKKLEEVKKVLNNHDKIMIRLR